MGQVGNFADFGWSRMALNLGWCEGLGCLSHDLSSSSRLAQARLCGEGKFQVREQSIPGFLRPGLRIRIVSLPLLSVGQRKSQSQAQIQGVEKQTPIFLFFFF